MLPLGQKGPFVPFAFPMQEVYTTILPLSSFSYLFHQLQRLVHHHHEVSFTPCLWPTAALTLRLPQKQPPIVMHPPHYFDFHYRSVQLLSFKTIWRRQPTCFTIWSLTITKKRRLAKTMVPNGNRMMHCTKQHTKPNCSPWHFWMGITAHQLLWLRPSTTSNDELLSNLRSKTSKIYIHWWSKRTWNRSSFGSSTNMHLSFDNNVGLWISLYKDWTFLQTPVIQETHQTVKYNNTALPGKKSAPFFNVHSCFPSRDIVPLEFCKPSLLDVFPLVTW